MIGKSSMNTTASNHRLTEVDRERRTALCSVCGPTRIYLRKPDKAGRVRISCFQKQRAFENEYQRKRREQKRLQNPNWKPRHLLTEIDAEKMTAICSICGPTEIRKRIQRQKYTTYICNTKKRAYAQEYKGSRYVYKRGNPPQPRHRLSEIDDENKTAECSQCGRVQISIRYSQGKIFRRCGTAEKAYGAKIRHERKEFINAYKVQHSCKNCGYQADPLMLVLHRRDRGEKEKISRLMGFGHERLLRELEKDAVYCLDCYSRIHAEPDLSLN